MATWGQVYPIARGTGPLVVALAAGPLAAERLGILGSIGLLMVSGGIVALAGRGGSKRAVAFALGTGFCIGAYSLADGLGARESENPLGYIVWLHLAIGIPFASAVLLLKRKQVPPFSARSRPARGHRRLDRSTGLLPRDLGHERNSARLRRVAAGSQRCLGGNHRRGLVGRTLRETPDHRISRRRGGDRVDELAWLTRLRKAMI